MKKIFIVLLAAASVAFVGCQKRLDIPQKGVISMDSFYQTDADAESALVTAYYTAGRFLSNTMWTTAGWNDCPLLSMWSYASDDMFVAGSDKTDGVSGNEIQTFRHDMNNSLIQGTYECYYMIVNQCNNVILNFENKENQTATMKRCVAEARVLRAQMQLLLALAWGTPPIVDYQLSGGDKPANAESQAAEFEWIVKECEKAIPDLTSKSSVSDAAKSIVVTKEYAYALMGKTQCFQHDYTAAKTSLKKVIDSNLYKLVPGSEMENLNHNLGKCTTEAVFELAYNFDPGIDNYGRTQPNFRWLWSWRADKLANNGPTGQFTQNGWGWCNPSKKFVDAILALDGPDSYRRKAWIKSYDEVLYEMPWLSDGSNFVAGKTAAKETDDQRGIKAGDGLYGHCGYFMWKRLFRVQDKVSDGNVADWNLTIMRYAEVLLLYAEACAKTSDDGSGLKALKEVHTRAGAASAVNSLTMDAVMAEKYVENWLDGTRFQDVVRWGTAATELGECGQYYPNYCDAMFSKGEAKHRGYIEEANAGWAKQYGTKFKAGKNELFPFPFCEIQVNPNIVQNPGY